MALIPVFLGVLYAGFPGCRYWALGVFIIASLTDTLDGYIARHYNQITNFGKFMDPLADKVLVLSAMCWFVECGQMPGWAAAWSGKVKTASTMVCLCLMMLNIPAWLNLACIVIIVATTVYSGIEYFIKNAQVFKNAD